MKKRICTLALALILMLGMTGETWAAGTENALSTATEKAFQYLYTNVPAPKIAQIGGEWAIFALARGGSGAPAGYYAQYYQRVEETIKAKNGVLHSTKYTEYSRVVLALSAVGKDARSVAGYDLTAPLLNSAKVNDQGINGTIFALLALDSVKNLTSAAVKAAKQGYIQTILDEQLDDGGWNLGGNKADPDLTAMALQALAKYTDQSAVSAAIDRGVARLGKKQSADGGYINAYGEANVETTAQVIVALCELGVPLNDTRFVKEGHTLLDNLLSFQSEDGGFKHCVSDEENDGISSEQGAYALAAAKRISEGKSSLYRMNDAVDLAAGSDHPSVTDNRGNIIAAETVSDGSMRYSVTMGNVTAVIQGSGNSFSITSTNDIACVVLTRETDGNFHKKTISTVGGTHTFSVNAGEELVVAVTGDLDGNGSVNALEARTALKASTNASTLDQLKTAIADLNADKSVSALEARQMLRASTNPTALAW